MIDSGNIGHLYNQRLLKMASTGGSLDEILMLLNRAEIDCRNNEGMTPLHIATSRGDIQIVNILINNGAGVDKADIRGTTPLIVACSIGNVEIVNALVAANADVNKVAKHGATPLLMASYSDINHLEVIKILINNGADYYKADYNGDTPISLAKKKGHTARIQYFQDLNWQRRRSLYLMRLYEDHEENKTHSPTALGRFLIDKTDRTGQDIRRIVASFLWWDREKEEVEEEKVVVVVVVVVEVRHISTFIATTVDSGGIDSSFLQKKMMDHSLLRQMDRSWVILSYKEWWCYSNRRRKENKKSTKYKQKHKHKAR